MPGTGGLNGAVELQYLISQAKLTGAYIFVTYILMNDGSAILDPDSPCAAGGTGDGSTWIDIPVPALSPLPDALYTSFNDTGGHGYASRPIGRCTKIIQYDTCAHFLTDHPLG